MNMKTKTAKNKILSVRIEQKFDDSPDLSYLGQYIWKAEPLAYIIEGEHAGKFVCELPEDAELPRNYGRGSAPFILPGNHVPHNPKNWAHVPPPQAAEVIAEFGSLKNADLEFARRDCRRLTRFADDWHSVGVIAKAEINVAGVVQTIHSRGLWGVESDMGAEYFHTLGGEQLADLREQLVHLGFGTRAIDRAFQSANYATYPE